VVGCSRLGSCHITKWMETAYEASAGVIDQ
jgi:hypothetical protein